MSIRNVIALLSHVGRSELLPRWQSEEVDDELLTDIDLDNFKILGLTDQQARTAVAFKTGGFRLQSPAAPPGGNYGRVVRLLDHIGRQVLLSGGALFSFIWRFLTFFDQLFKPRKLTTISYPTSTTAISLLSASRAMKWCLRKLSDPTAICPH